MLYLLFFLFATYFVFVLALLAGFKRAVSALYPVHPSPDLTISVIVPFRNEAGQLQPLLSSLETQTYEKFEVIFINDHSADEGPALIEAKTIADPRFILLHSEKEGKKEALSHGIKFARGEVIVTTDADCVLHRCWLEKVSTVFHSEEVMLAFGAVKLHSNGSIRSSIEAVEFAGVVATGVGSFGLGIPLYCNAANLAFRKEAFNAVGGYDGNLHIASGDDEFLLKKIAAMYREGVRYVHDPEAIVSTSTSATVKQFFHQRLRWASKWRHTPGYVSKITASFLLLVQCAVLVSIGLILTGEDSKVLKFLVGGKVLLEFVFLFIACAEFRVRLRVFDFILLQAIYPFYVLYIGIFCNFGSFEWKGRKI